MPIVIGAALVDGSRDHGVAYVQDITARREAEAQLRESEARFRNMAEHSPLILWMADADGRCIYVNQNWYDFSGVPAGGDLGGRVLRRGAPRRRRGRPRRCSGAIASRTGYRHEARVRRRDGVYRHMIDNASPRFGPDGEFLGTDRRPHGHPGPEGRRGGPAAAGGAAAPGAEDGGARHPRRRRRARLQQHPRRDHRQRRTGAGGSRGGAPGAREPGGSGEGERARPRARPADPHVRAAAAGRAARHRAARGRRGIDAAAARDAAGGHRAGHRVRARRPQRARRSLAHPPGGDEPLHQRVAGDSRRRRPDHGVAGDGARHRRSRAWPGCGPAATPA